ncbi:MAG: hypothetical protein V7K40_33680 [Nostoc sp.]|uniref:hypothetical protein n=1 Tax=Nostoc sp. TaxID=1180 RepID=UPI002FFB186D
MPDLHDGLTPRLFAIADCTARPTKPLRNIAAFALGVGFGIALGIVAASLIF